MHLNDLHRVYQSLQRNIYTVSEKDQFTIKKLKQNRKNKSYFQQISSII